MGDKMTDFSSFPLFMRQYTDNQDGVHGQPLPIGRWACGGLTLIIEQGMKHNTSVDRRISIQTNERVILTDQQWATISAVMLHNESITRPPPHQKGAHKKLEYLRDYMIYGGEEAAKRHKGKYKRQKLLSPRGMANRVSGASRASGFGCQVEKHVITKLTPPEPWEDGL
jgi:hypothetical protein